jgi:hypothetical protein
MGEMRVIGVDTTKLTKTKAVLIVKFWQAKSLKDATMQMYCTSLEPIRGLGQDADLSILTGIKYALPQAKSLNDIGVRVMSATFGELNSCELGVFRFECFLLLLLRLLLNKHF